MDYDLGFFDEESNKVDLCREPVYGKTVTYVPGPDRE